MKFRTLLLSVLTSVGICISAQADETISSGLTLKIPSQGAKNWGTAFKNDFATPISGHDHTGSGKGLQISTNAIATNAVTGAKIRLANNEYMKARNAANSADVDMLKLNTSNTMTIALPFTNSSILITGASILADTVDASDTGALTLGHTGVTRGGRVVLYGNEHATNAGQVLLSSGNAPIYFAIGLTPSLAVSTNGDLTPFSDDGNDLGDSSHAFKNLWVKQRTWTPTLGAAGGLNDSATTYARYTTLGKIVNWRLYATFQVTVASATLTATAPATSANLGNTQGGACECGIGSLVQVCSWNIGNSASTFTFYRYDNSNFSGGGATLTIICSGSFEAA